MKLTDARECISSLNCGALYLLEDDSSPHDADASDEKKSGGTVEVVHPPWHWLLQIDISI